MSDDPYKIDAGGVIGTPIPDVADVVEGASCYIPEDVVLVWRFEAATWADACASYYRTLGWGAGKRKRRQN